MRKRYFFMDQDPGLADAIGLRDFDINGKRHLFTSENADQINDITALYMDETAGECAADFIKSPVYMVSEMAFDVIDMYEDDLPRRKIVLIHKEEGSQLVYCHLLLRELEMKHALTEHYPNGMEKRLVLDLEKIGQHKAFLLADSKIKLPVVSLEVVESLMRRGVTGVTFREVEVA